MLPRAPEERVRLLPRGRAHAALLPEAEGARRPPQGGRQARQGAAREVGGAQRERRGARQGHEPLRGAGGLQHPREAQGGVPGAPGAPERAQEGGGAAAGRLGRREHALGRPAGAAARPEARRRGAALERAAGVRRRAAREAVADARGDRRRRGVLRQQPRRRGRRRAPPDPHPGAGAAPPLAPERRRVVRLPHGRGRRQVDEPAADQEAPQVGDEEARRHRARVVGAGGRHRAAALLQPRRGLRRRALGRRLGLGLRRVKLTRTLFNLYIVYTLMIYA